MKYTAISYRLLWMNSVFSARRIREVVEERESDLKVACGELRWKFRKWIRRCNSTACSLIQGIHTGGSDHLHVYNSAVGNDGEDNVHSPLLPTSSGLRNQHVPVRPHSIQHPFDVRGQISAGRVGRKDLRFDI